MLIPEGSSIFELEIKRSRFIAEAFPVDSPAAARDCLKRKRLEHPDARHVVHAFITGPRREHMGLSDDGEPSGTSGKPVLEIMKGRGITDVMVTVVRYFGGIKLGTGGLVRAYSESASGALDGLAVKELVDYRSFILTADYSFYRPVKDLLEASGCVIEFEDFGTEVGISGRVPTANSEDLAAAVLDVTNGRTRIDLD